jgi:hypothetical protein
LQGLSYAVLAGSRGIVAAQARLSNEMRPYAVLPAGGFWGSLGGELGPLRGSLWSELDPEELALSRLDHLAGELRRVDFELVERLAVDSNSTLCDDPAPVAH